MTCNDVSAITAGFYEIYKSEVHPIDTAYRYDDHFSRLLAVVSTKKKKKKGGLCGKTTKEACMEDTKWPQQCTFRSAHVLILSMLAFKTCSHGMRAIDRLHCRARWPAGVIGARARIPAQAGVEVIASLPYRCGCFHERSDRRVWWASLILMTTLCVAPCARGKTYL